MARIRIRRSDLERMPQVQAAEPKIVEKIVEVPASTEKLDREIAELKEQLEAARSVAVVDYIFTVHRDKRQAVQRIDAEAKEQPPMKARDGKTPRSYGYEIKVGERDGLGLIKTVTAIAKPAPSLLNIGRTAKRNLN